MRLSQLQHYILLTSKSFSTNDETHQHMGVDYYKVLGVPRDAGEDEIKKAYKKMVCSAVIFVPVVQADTSSVGSEVASRPQWRV